jgi:hypothetical protein
MKLYNFCILEHILHHPQFCLVIPESMGFHPAVVTLKNGTQLSVLYTHTYAAYCLYIILYKVFLNIVYCFVALLKYDIIKE